METIAVSDIEEINLAPATEEEDVRQCMGMILKTPQGSVPFMRPFGMSTTYYGRPITGDENDIVDELYEQVEKYESRVEIDGAEFEENGEDGEVEISIPYRLISEEEDDDD